MKIGQLHKILDFVTRKVETSSYLGNKVRELATSIARTLMWDEVFNAELELPRRSVPACQALMDFLVKEKIVTKAKLLSLQKGCK